MPGRGGIGAYWADTAAVGGNGGWTGMSVAPLALAFIGHLKPQGWHSAMFEPMNTMASEFCRSIWKVVLPPRPKETPRPGTVAECHIRAWFSIRTTPIIRFTFAMR